MSQERLSPTRIKSWNYPFEAGFRQGFARIVAQCGWQLSRINGSHHIFIMPGHRERLVIPIHGNQPLKTGLLRSLMKVAGLEEKDL